MVTSGKRKHNLESSFLASRTAVVSYPTMSWEETRKKLQNFSQSLRHNADTELLTNHAKTMQESNQQYTTLEKEAQEMEQKLDQQIKEALAHCQKESEHIYELQVALTELQASRDALMLENDEADTRQHALMDEIAKYKELANEQVDAATLVEEEQKMKVPRLQNQIKLYANVSGIKWNYGNEHMLEGRVAVPCQESFHDFCLDPSELSNYEIANRLWNMMEGAY